MTAGEHAEAAAVVEVVGAEGGEHAVQGLLLGLADVEEHEAEAEKAGFGVGVFLF